jgi:hypothetical protein
MKQAAALHAPLTVIAVHEVPKSYWGSIPVTGAADIPLLAKLRQAAEEMTQKAASRLCGQGTGRRFAKFRPGGRRHTRRRRVCPADNGLGEQSGHPTRGVPSRDRPGFFQRTLAAVNGAALEPGRAASGWG